MTDYLKPYRPYLRAGKAIGSPPPATAFDTAHRLGARVGSKVAMAIAMYLRPEGATSGQVVIACGGPQLNKMRGLIEAGLLKRVDQPNTEAGHTVYHCAVTAKGGKVAAKADNGGGEATPAKPAKAKARKRKAKATPQVDTGAGGEPAAGDAPQGEQQPQG